MRIRPFLWWNFRALAQGADLIAVGVYVSKEAGIRGGVDASGIAIETTDQTVGIRIDRVIAGDAGVAGTEVSFKGSGADSFFSAIGATALVFLTKDGDHYRLVFNNAYGSFPLNDPGPVVRCQFYAVIDGEMQEAYPTLQEVAEKIRSFRRASVQIAVHIPREIAIADESLPIRVSHSNSGTHPVNVLPPSAYTNLLWVARLRSGQRHPHRDPGKGVGNWSFLSEPEKTKSVEPHSVIETGYKIPLSDLGVMEAGEYAIQVSFGRFTIEAVKRFENEIASDSSEVWLGIPPVARHILSVK